MNEMKYRLKKLRKTLDLTQKQLAEILHIKQNTVASYELGRIMPSDSVICGICRELNVNEEWLRFGIGEMFNPQTNSELDALTKKYNLDQESRALIEKILYMKKEERDIIINFIKTTAIALQQQVNMDTDIFSGIPDTPEELEKLYPPIEDSKQGIG